MADNDNNKKPVNNVDNTQSKSILLEEEKTRQRDKINAAMVESENLWKKFTEKQNIMLRLFKEQIALYDLFMRKNHIEDFFREIIEGNMDASRRIKEINEEAQQIMPQYAEFIMKLHISGKIIKDFIQKMTLHLAKLEKGLKTVSNAETVEDVVEMDIPNLEWTEIVPDPEIEELGDLWDQLRLKSTIIKEFKKRMLVIKAYL